MKTTLKIISILLLTSQVGISQTKYTFSKTFTQTSIGDWIQFGQINGLPTGTFINVKAYAHFANQLFYEEFEIAATSYGNAGLDWVEVAPKLTNGYDGHQSFALDARYKCNNSCPLELRLRRLFGGGGAGDINFIVESNAAFSEVNIQGNSGVVSPGYLGNNGGWKFPVSSITFGASQQGLFITDNGNVAIGTTNPQGYKLAVAGNMVAESVKVKLQGTWPDYVFIKDYELPSLQSTEQHIKNKGHLPGIPSATEAIANGINLGEMNAKLLQKIEEITLHLIMEKQNQKLAKQSAEMLKQSQEIKALKETVSTLQKTQKL